MSGEQTDWDAIRAEIDKQTNSDLADDLEGMAEDCASGKVYTPSTWQWILARAAKRLRELS